MYKINDISGRKFGKLTAIEPTNKRIGGRIVWKCRCECGNELEVSSKYLLSGSRTRCDKCVSKDRYEDLSGRKYGILTVLGRANDRKWNGSCRSTIFKCICDCGGIVYVSAGHLKSGHTRSCGCLQKKVVSKISKTHGLSNEKIHSIWKSMISRCENTGNSSYKNYGARGVSVCSEWKADFMSFYSWAMSSGYKEGLSIERIDVNGDYSPSNCTWVTYKEQQNNKRDNHFISFNGRTQTMAQWAEEIGINYQTLSYRINIAKWSVERALTEPVRGK